MGAWQQWVLAFHHAGVKLQVLGEITLLADNGLTGVVVQVWWVGVAGSELCVSRGLQAGELGWAGVTLSGLS